MSVRQKKRERLRERDSEGKTWFLFHSSVCIQLRDCDFSALVISIYRVNYQ